MKLFGLCLLVIAACIVLIVLILLVIVLIASSKGLPELVDEQNHSFTNSISKKEFIEINGIKQGIFLRGESLDNPVLLFLHGGPGSPELPMALAEETSQRIESEFIVCYWDQRGAGMSYGKVNPDTMTLEQMIKDTIAVTNYLLARFNQTKIYLMGHSWGSYLGVKTIEQYPNAYYAYLGIGQIAHQRQSERLGYLYLLEHAKKINDKKAVNKLLEVDVNSPSFPESTYTYGIRSSLMNKYGVGIYHKDAFMTWIIKTIFLCPAYTVREKIHYMQGMLFSGNHLFHYVLEDNLLEHSTTFDLPIYILQGKYDYQVSYQLAQEYYNAIHAPSKEFYTFDESAHSPIWEEPDKFMTAMREIKKQVDLN